MVTRGAIAKANKKQAPAPQVVQDAGSDSDDEAPEVVSKVSAQEQALEQLRHEKEAKAKAAAAAASVKRKRKTRTEAPEESEAVTAEDVEQEATEDAPELPADVLSAIATRDEEDRTEQELEEAREQLRRKRAAAAKKRTHIRDFGSVKVQTLEALDAAESRKLTEAAAAFLDRKAAPHRARMNVLEGHATQFTKSQKRRL